MVWSESVGGAGSDMGEGGGVGDGGAAVLDVAAGAVQLPVRFCWWPPLFPPLSNVCVLEVVWLFVHINSIC